MKTKPTVVRISRKKWSRAQGGKGLAANALLVNRRMLRNIVARDYETKPKVGNMCCLGFACLAKGLSKRAISGHAMPADTENAIDGLTRVSNGVFTNGIILDEGWTSEAASINDNAELSDRERERALRELAAENGFEFVFVP